MGDQVLGHRSESWRYEEGISSREERTGDEESSFERQLKRIWIYSSGKKVGSFGRTRMGNKGSNTDFVSKPRVNPRIEVNKSLKERAENGKSQIKLNYLPRFRVVPSGVAENGKQGENGFNSDDRSEKVQEASSLSSESSRGSENIGSSTEPSLESSKRGENIGSSAESPLESNEVRESLQKMSDEIMRYELRLAGLHGRIAVLHKENERLRDDRAIRETLANQLVEETKRRESKKLDTGGRERVESSLSIGESGKGESPTGETQATSSPESSKSDHTAYRRLKQLESRILERLEEYKSLTAMAEQNISAMSDERNALQLESPFVTELKAKIIRLHEELTQFRSIHGTRLSNMKRAFQREQGLKLELERQLYLNRQVLQKWAVYGQKANEHITRYKSLLQEQSETTSSSSKKKEAQMSNLQENYKKVVEAYQSLSQVAEARRRDIGALNSQLNDSKLKNKSLEAIILQQRAQIVGLLSSTEARPLTNFPASQNGLPHSHLSQSTPGEHHVNNFSSGPTNQQLNPSNPGFRTATPPNVQNGINASARPIKQESPVLNFTSDQIGVFLESPNANERRDRT